MSSQLMWLRCKSSRCEGGQASRANQRTEVLICQSGADTEYDHRWMSKRHEIDAMQDSNTRIEGCREHTELDLDCGLYDYKYRSSSKRTYPL